MANIKFFHTNVLSVASTLKNGTGGGAPALDEDADFPMSNLTIADRYLLWKTSAAPADPLQIDFSINSATIKAFGLANYDASWVGQQVDFYYSTSAYPPGGWTLGASITPDSTRNNMLTEVNIASVRSIRVELNLHALASSKLAKFLAFTGVLDIGKQSAPGSSEEYIQQTTREETFGGLPILTRTGPDKRRFRLLWPTASATIKSGMDTLLRLGTSFFLMTHESVPYEVCFANGRLVKPRIWDPPALYDLDVLLDELP